MATGVIAAGMCKTVAVFRAMNGFSQVRIGGTVARSAIPVVGDDLHSRAYGWQSAGQMFAPTFLRLMYEFGTTHEKIAMAKVTHSQTAERTPKAVYPKTMTVD